MRLNMAITCLLLLIVGQCGAAEPELLSWIPLPPVPDELGFAGPFAGVHHDALILAGGANFPRPVWENTKVWHDRIFVLTKHGDTYAWKDGGKLPRAVAYGASVSTQYGVVCMGGNDAATTFADVFLLSWDAEAQRITTTPFPSLPKPCAFSAATLLGDVIYLAGGQSGQSLETAMTNLWSLDLSPRASGSALKWKELPGWPGPTRALNLTVSQRNEVDDCVFVISGRRQQGDEFGFLKDVWEYTPTTGSWRQRADAPRCLMAGTAIGYGQNRVFVLGGATEKLFFQGNDLKDEHPGFIKQSLAYDTIADVWTEAGATPANHVTTVAVKWGDDIIIPTGEVRPRVRSPQVFRVTPVGLNDAVVSPPEPQTN